MRLKCTKKYRIRVQYEVYPTYGSLESSWDQAPCGLLGAGQQGEEGEEEPQHRVAGHDDRVRGHAPGPRVPATGHSDEDG